MAPLSFTPRRMTPPSPPKGLTAVANVLVVGRVVVMGFVVMAVGCRYGCW